jgi:hypothetical protein
MRHWLAVPAALLLLSACASSGAKASSPTQDRNIITADEIARSSEHNALTLIRTVRPGMLHQRGNTSLSNLDPGIVVFMNGQRYGDVASLEGIETTTIEEIRFLTEGQAQSRFGPGYPQGVILVTTRTQ